MVAEVKLIVIFQVIPGNKVFLEDTYFSEGNNSRSVIIIHNKGDVTIKNLTLENVNA